MTFRAEGTWLAVRIAQMDRVMVATTLFPMPLARVNYLGLVENGHELVPVLRLGSGSTKGLQTTANGGTHEHLVVVLHVRGEPVGMAIDVAGNLYQHYELGLAPEPKPSELHGVAGLITAPGRGEFWLIDTDQLWPAPELPIQKSA